MTWTAKDVVATGDSRQLHFVDYLRRSERARADSKREQRLAMHECRWCFYVGHGMAGQALTEYTCASCKTEQMHGNTAVPKLCIACADAFGACRRCGGTMEWEVSTLLKQIEDNERRHLEGKTRKRKAKR